jgi:hypothetical protein
MIKSNNKKSKKNRKKVLYIEKMPIFVGKSYNITNLYKNKKNEKSIQNL